MEYLVLRNGVVLPVETTPSVVSVLKLFEEHDGIAFYWQWATRPGEWYVMLKDIHLDGGVRADHVPEGVLLAAMLV